MAPLSTTCALLGLIAAAAATAGALAGNSSALFHFPESGRIRAATSGRPSPLRVPSVPAGSSSSQMTVSVSSKPSPTSSPPVSGSPAATTTTTTTLLPSTHWDVDTKPAANVKPVPPGMASSPLFYGDAGASKAGHFAFLSYTFTKPSVNLDHADDAAVSVLDRGRLSVDFHTREAFQHAFDSWSVVHGLVLIVYADGCGSTQGERCFFDVDGLEVVSNSSRIIVRGRAAHPHQVSSGGETEWGWWTPHEKPSRLTKRRRSWKAFWAAAKRLFFSDLIGPSVSYGAEKTLSWALPNASSDAKTSWPLTNSPWGRDAVLLKAAGSPDANGTDPFLRVFCVQCGASGQARLAGRAAWSFQHGLTEGHMELRTDMAISLKVGIDARAGIRTEIDKHLMSTALPGLNFGPVAVEPHVSIRARAIVDTASQGRLLAGAEMGLRNAHAIVDLVGSSKRDMGGWKPYLEPVLEANGHVALSAVLGLPVAFECSLRIGPWSRMVAIVDEPSIGAKVQSLGAVQTSKKNSRFLAVGFHSQSACAGIDTQLSWRNFVSYRTNAAGQNDQSLFDSGRQRLAPKCIHA
ncbi:hypothetical protein XA68_11680 [Ophiocordyceps unilateralis]|uniref:DUF7029 domain-containing protein n=1 Tax=Ophiocordyceps unilateralis TaxID=268505 RepID=A0A2A9PFZ8_OPHUN|nr:hypothetical protein XA68_11680 [Ophiocordyceps unilateralis]